MTPKLSPEEALSRAAALCSASEQCAHDIQEKLTRWQIGPDETRRIIERLEQNKFIDETRYCRSFVHDKFRFNKWGRIKIACALRQKGISPSAIDEALAAIDEESYLDTLRQLLAAKRKSIGGAPSDALKAKLLRFAASRGFEPACIYPLLNRISE
ncbi:MAG: RecX family transcriptional regulator [Coprobacter sp.]|nr:RecX family transcriptional regulator [Coprobacter sp.]